MVGVFVLTGLSRLTHARPLRWQMEPGTGVTMFFAMVFGGTLAVSTLREFVASPDGLQGTFMALVAVWAFQAAIVGVFIWARLVKRPPDTTRGTSPLQAMGMGVLGVAIFWPITVALSGACAHLQAWITGEMPSPLAHGLLAELADADPTFWAWVVAGAVVIGPPVLEEIAYRGGLQEGLRRLWRQPLRGGWLAIVVTSGIFVVMHVGGVSPHALPGLFVLSLGFGWVVVRTGSLLAGITMHALFNAGNVLLGVPWMTH